MTTLKKFNLKGEDLGQVQVEEAFLNAEANGQMIKDYIVAIRANARQWSANTKGRSEVNHTTKKPHPQKGGGRSRQGSLAAPQYKGGGRVFAPKPKFDQHIRINKKERRAAIRFLLAEKIRDGRVYILDTTDVEAPKTQIVSHFIKSQLSGKRVLFLGESNFVDLKYEDITHRVNVPSTKHANFILSMRNIPKTEFSLASNVSGYDVVVAHDIVMTEEAFKELSDWLC